ncbi:MAG: O-antigen ligase family protein [Bacteroidetes bacterium]|nr:O-antigen ligase family protein [Bacteroidota bacterium]
MSKNNPVNQKLLLKTNIALICAIGAIIGFLWSRSVLSFFTFAFGVNALWDVHPKRWFREKWWVLGVLWIAMYAISFFWTDDTHNWNTRLEVKLPILLLPLAFAFLPSLSAKQIRIFAVSVSILFLISVGYSLSFFFKDMAFYAEQYTFSHVLPTLAYGEHIRYSLAIVLFIIWLVSVWNELGSKWLKVFIGLTIAILSVYLHILAARSGLIVWYLFMLIWSLRFAFKKNMIIGFATLVLLFTGATLAATYIPTLEKRVWYFKHSYELYQSNQLNSGYSDIGRVISYKLAKELIAEHPVTGVGAGDMYNDMMKQYEAHYPDVPSEYRLIPHNQFVIVALGCGIPAMLLFAVWVFYPLLWLRAREKSFYIFMCWLSVNLSLLFEPMLEIQLGIFVYVFFLLWQQYTLRGKARNAV